MSTLVEYRVRVRNSLDNADVLVVSSVRGDSLPYLVDAPHGDGSEFDPFTGAYRSGSMTCRIADAITSGTTRVVTSQLEDANYRQQLASRPAYVEMRLNGGAWTGVQAGIVTAVRLSSAAIWDIDVGDATRATRNLTAFAPKRLAGDATKVEALATYMARWPNRGAILGGKVTGGFLHAADLGGWEMNVVDRQVYSTSTYTPPGGGAAVTTTTRIAYLKFQAGYGTPAFKRTTDYGSLRDAVNTTLGPIQAVAAHTFPELEATGAGGWRDVVIQIGSQYFAGSFSNRNNTDSRFLVNDSGASGLFVWDSAQLLTVGANVRVKVYDALPSERSPIYYTGHPVDLWIKLCDEAGLFYDGTAATACKDAIGRALRITLRITGAQAWSSFVESTLFGPCGFSVRTDSINRFVPFATRVLTTTVPGTTITNADVPQDGTVLYDLSEPDAITKVVFNQQAMPPLPENNVDPSTPADGIRLQSVTIERVTGDAAATVQREQSYSIPGYLDTGSGSYETGLVDTMAAQIFDRAGRGRLSGEVQLLRGGAGDGLLLGQECVIALKAMPNHNKRLGDDNTVPGRVVQAVRLTPSPAGTRMRFIDSGPNAQPVATLPTYALALGAAAGSVLMAIGNAATLNTGLIAVRVQWAITSGGVPVSADYTDVRSFVAGAVPTAVFALPSVTPGQTVYVRARSEHDGLRPSNYNTAVSLATSPAGAPSALTATPDAGDGSRSVLAWTIGTNAASLATDVFVRLSTGVAADDVRRVTLPPGSTTFTLDDLTPSTSYTASVQHRDPGTGAVTAKTTVTFTTSAAVPTITAPVNPSVFAGQQGGDAAVLDGTYGLAVEASVIPGSIEFREAVETAPSSGAFGAFASVGVLPAVLGDWTILDRTAANDGMLRRLGARSIRAGLASAWTASKDVLPWSVVRLPIYDRAPVSLDNFRRSAEVPGVSITYSWALGALTTSVWAKSSVVATNASDPWPAVAAAVVSIGTATSITIPWPGPGQMTLLQVEPRDALLVAGPVIRQAIEKSVNDGIPKIVQTTVNGTVVTVLGNANVQSIRMRDMSAGGTWESWVDCTGAPSSSVDLSVISATGVAGIGAGVTWPVQLDVYAKPKASAGGLTPDTQSVTVTNGASTAPTWVIASGAQPATSSAVATLTLQASSAPAGHTVRVSERHDIGVGFTTYANITASLTPVPSAPPTTSTAYTYTTAYTATAGGAGSAQVTYQFKCEILNGSSVVVRTTTFFVVWYYT